MEVVGQRQRHRWHIWKSIPFFGTHIAAVVGIALLGWSWTGFGLAMLFYAVRMFGITAGYHRYFAHRTYKMGRGMQFLMALLGTTATQKGVLWWAGHHRSHHKYSDQPGDVHSVRQDGFLHSHVGWILTSEYNATDYDKIKDFTKYPELMWLNKYHLVPPVVFAVALYLIGGAWALTWGFFVSTTLLWHGTFTINSLSHLIGTRRYVTTDDSRNNFVLALITLGEGWHNNHHYYQRSTTQGFYWWEIDLSMYMLRLLSVFRLVSDLQVPPEHVRERRDAPELIAAMANTVLPSRAPAVAAGVAVPPPRPMAPPPPAA